ncbi:MAG: aminomethyl transferase family protein [Ignavibacteriaceae bacterium]|nr:aminomethyl transferase family protein [Ignavibacteriaceae bacterium]
MLTEFYKTENVALIRAFGREYPRYFVHPLAEYRALVGSCGVIDLTHWRVLRVTGRDRARFLNAMVTNDVASLEPSRGRHTTMTTVKGKILSELFVFARKEDHLVVVSQGDFDGTVGTMRKHVVADDVAIEDVSADHAIIAVEGPRAKAVVGLLFRAGPLPKAPLDLVEREFEKFTLTVIQNSVAGETGYHVLVRSDEALRIRNYLVQAARGADGLPVGHDAWNIRRVEKGLPWYGVDFDGDHFPQEARLGHTVSYTKGCFRGQETLARLENRGHVNRFLVGLAPEGPSVFPADLAGRLAEIAGLSDHLLENEFRKRAAGDAQALDLGSVLPRGTALHPAMAHSNDKPAGTITSAVYSFAVGSPLCLGYVRADASGTALFAGTTHGPVRMREATLPEQAS